MAGYCPKCTKRTIEKNMRINNQFEDTIMKTAKSVAEGLWNGVIVSGVLVITVLLIRYTMIQYL